MSPQAAVDSHDDEVSLEVDRFEGKVNHRLHQAELLLLLWLIGALSVKHGVIAATAANMLLLESIPTQFDKFLTEVGFDAEVSSFVSGFGSQIDAFGRLLRTTGNKGFKFTKSDLDLFVAKQKLSTLTLVGVAQAAADRARDLASLSIGARVAELHDLVTDSLASISPRLKKAARLELMTFYRTVADQGYRLIEQVSPGVARYAYVGPGAGDPVIRPFCKHLMIQAAAGRTWTRAEIDTMDNLQLPNVMVSGGGFNCRHIWILNAH